MDQCALLSKCPSYIAELRKLARYCKFDAQLNDSLRDRFVCGLRYENIQKRLLSESELTLDKAIELAIAMETAASDASELQGQRHPQPVNKFTPDSAR